MGNTEIIKSIKLSFEELSSESSAFFIKEAIENAVGRINRLQTSDKNLNLLLRKISADLMKSYSNQLQYSELRNKTENRGLNVKPKFDRSFFESLTILKLELFAVLEKL